MIEQDDTDILTFLLDIKKSYIFKKTLKELLILFTDVSKCRARVIEKFGFDNVSKEIQTTFKKEPFEEIELFTLLDLELSIIRIN